MEEKLIMNKWPKDEFEALNNFFGRLEIGEDGQPAARWEHSNLDVYDLPYPMRLAWNKGIIVRRICCNKMVRKSLLSILERIQKKIGPDRIKAEGLDQFGGCYCFRPRRRSHALSLHSWAAAIDLNPMGNDPGSKGTMPEDVVELFEEEGWTWGGRWKNRDAMHFEATS